MDEVTIYIDQLKSDDFATKRLAIEILGEMGDRRAIHFLFGMLGDEEWQIRNTAIDAIIKIDKELAIEPLISLLRDTNASVRNAAISALQLVGEKAVNSLRKGLVDPDNDVKIFTANTLGFIASPSAVPWLLATLENAELSSNLEFAIIEAFGRIKSHEATSAILDRMRKVDVWDRFNYLNTLGLIGDERAMTDVLRCYDDDETLEAAITAAGLIGDEIAVDRTIEALYHEDNDIRKAALLALSRIKHCIQDKHRLTLLNYSRTYFFSKIKGIDFHNLAETIQGIFDEDDRELQIAVIKLLRFSVFPIAKGNLLELIAKEELLDELIELFQVHQCDELADICQDIFSQEEQFILNFFTLANCCSIKVADHIVLQALRHPFNEIRSHVTIYCGLQGIFSPEIVEELTKALLDPSEKVSKAAEGALIMHQSPEFTELIGKYLVWHEESLKAFALHYIAFNDYSVTEEFLLSLLTNHSEEVRTKAILVIRSYLHKGVLKPNEGIMNRLMLLLDDESQKVQLEVLATIESFLTPDLVSRLIPIVMGLSYNIKVHSIKALTAKPCPESDLLLISLLEDPYPEVRLTAIHGMKQSFSRQDCLQALRNSLNRFDVDIQGEALEVIGHIGSSNDIPLLESYLQQDNWFLKVSSIKAMGRLGDPTVIPSLIRVLESVEKSTAFEIILEALINTLGKLSAVEAVMPLRHFLSFRTLQVAISRAFLSIGEKDLTPFALLAKKGETPLSRLIALSTLAQGGYADADFYQDILLTEEYSSVRRVAAEAITINLPQEAIQRILVEAEKNNDPITHEILRDSQTKAH